MVKSKLHEFNVVNEFTNILGLPNQTDGSIYIYKNANEHTAKKPDGYYFLEGVTFILDAKNPQEKFTGQLEDYMIQETNPNFIGFKFNHNIFECYVNGKLISSETEPKDAHYYIDTYFSGKKQTNESIVNAQAQKLANDFRDSNINKQINVPFIGAIMLCCKFNKNISGNTTNQILMRVEASIREIISDTPLERKAKKEFLIKTLGDSTLRKANVSNIKRIIAFISNVYEFINVSDRGGHDVMNNFLKVFRKWNSADAQEKGQVFTPDHIAHLMYKLIDCSKNDVILDPTCGSGTFLINALVNMLSEEKDKSKHIDIKENHVIGCEIDDFNATLAGINMMLHGDGASMIFCEDCFKWLPRHTNVANKVLMNPPFSQSVPELTFVNATLNNIQKDGLVAAIVPVNAARGLDFEKEREEILKSHTLLKTVLLPTNLFQPNAGTSTCILVFKAKTPHNVNNNIECLDFSDDGFIIAKHIGRIDQDNELKTKQFWQQKPVLKKINHKSNWLIEKEFDFNELTKLDFIKTKLDFIKTKLDFILTDRNLYKEVLQNNGNIKLNVFVSDKKLDISNWHSFKVSDVLHREKIKSISSIIRSFSSGYIPVITNTALNNGIGKRLNVTENKYLHTGNCLSYGAKGGLFFYQPNQWASTDHVHMFISKHLNLNVGLFLCTVLNKLILIKGGWSSGLESNILNENILLPYKRIDNKYEPDWEWMDKFIDNKF